MQISKKFLNILLALVLVIGVGSGAYFAYQNSQAAQALAENTEYQVLKAIETLHPEVYVVAVQKLEGNVLAYVILPVDELPEGDLEYLFIDIVAILYNAYPDAKTYHILPTTVIEADVFEGVAHLGIADVGLGFSPLAARMLAEYNTAPLDVLEQLYADNQWGGYDPARLGLNIITEPTAREKGHIPPWVEVEDSNPFKSFFD